MWPGYQAIESAALTLSCRRLYTETQHAAKSVTFKRRFAAVVASGMLLDACNAKTKESGVGIDQDDSYAGRQQEIERQFDSLPAAGSSAYWSVVESHSPEAPLLEVLGLCVLERLAAGAPNDAERVFSAIMKRVQNSVRGWASRITRYSAESRRSQIAEDLQLECLFAVWRELARGKPTFLLTNFNHALMRIQQHTAEAIMTREGEWKRRGVHEATRILNAAINSIERGLAPDGDEPVPLDPPDTSASQEFERVELMNDMAAALQALDPPDRDLLYDVYYRGFTQEQIAQQLQVVGRTVRNRLKRALEQLRRVYTGNEEEHRGE